MDMEERIATLEIAVPILQARLDKMDEGYTGLILPGIEPSEPVEPAPTYQDPDEFYQGLFDMPLGEIKFGMNLEFHYGVKLLVIGNQYLGIGAALGSHYKKIPEILMGLMTEECGEKWYNAFQRDSNQTGLTTYGTGVPHAFPCSMRSWKR